MIEKRTDIGRREGIEYFEARFFIPTGPCHLRDSGNDGRAPLTEIDFETMHRAHKLLLQISGSFVDSYRSYGAVNHHFLLSGAVIDIERDNSGNINTTCPYYLGILHEEKMDVAYVANKLKLPCE